MVDADECALWDESCVPCRGDVPALTPEERAPLIRELADGWEVVDGHHLSRHFEFDDFAKPLEFVNAVGAIAEGQGHHPDIYFTWGKVQIEICTHAIDGLTRSDFVLAAKIDQLSH